ncbi:MAG: alpha/beta hydrolase [Bryobacteraceae bacterium]
MKFFAPLLALCCSCILAGADDYSVRQDVVFSSPGGVALKLDAHIPPGKGPFPAVILVHGGGWTNGTKTANFVQPLFAPLTESGFAWFTIDYRLAPKHPYPAAVEDVEAAIRFVRSHAKEYKVDGRRIALMGESAGGHLVSLVGARNRKPANVAAVVCFYGPIDLVEFVSTKPGNKGMAAFLPSGQFREASPATYISGKTPPFLVIHGTKDDAVPYAQALLTVELLKKAGVRCDLITVQDGIHGVINWEKDARFQGYKKEMADWLRGVLK